MKSQPALPAEVHGARRKELARYVEGAVLLVGNGLLARNLRWRTCLFVRIQTSSTSLGAMSRGLQRFWWTESVSCFWNSRARRMHCGMELPRMPRCCGFPLGWMQFVTPGSWRVLVHDLDPSGPSRSRIPISRPWRLVFQGLRWGLDLSTAMGLWWMPLYR